MITPDMGRLNPLHPAAHVAVISGPEDQMKVVGHQAIGEDPHGAAILGCVKQLDKRVEVGRFVEHLLPSVATVQNVVAVAGRSGTKGARHAGF